MIRRASRPVALVAVIFIVHVPSDSHFSRRSTKNGAFPNIKLEALQSHVQQTSRRVSIGKSEKLKSQQSSVKVKSDASLLFSVTSSSVSLIARGFIRVPSGFFI